MSDTLYGRLDYKLEAAGVALKVAAEFTGAPINNKCEAATQLIGTTVAALNLGSVGTPSPLVIVNLEPLPEGENPPKNVGIYSPDNATLIGTIPPQQFLVIPITGVDTWFAKALVSEARILVLAGVQTD